MYIELWIFREWREPDKGFLEVIRDDKGLVDRLYDVIVDEPKSVTMRNVLDDVVTLGVDESYTLTLTINQR